MDSREIEKQTSLENWNGTTPLDNPALNRFLFGNSNPSLSSKLINVLSAVPLFSGGKGGFIPPEEPISIPSEPEPVGEPVGKIVKPTIGGDTNADLTRMMIEKLKANVRKPDVSSREIRDGIDPQDPKGFNFGKMGMKTLEQPNTEEIQKLNELNNMLDRHQYWQSNNNGYNNGLGEGQISIPKEVYPKPENPKSVEQIYQDVLEFRKHLKGGL